MSRDTNKTGKILIVDDNEDVLQAAKDLLEATLPTDRHGDQPGAIPGDDQQRAV